MQPDDDWRRSWWLIPQHHYPQHLQESVVQVDLKAVSKCNTYLWLLKRVEVSEDSPGTWKTARPKTRKAVPTSYITNTRPPKDSYELTAWTSIITDWNHTVPISRVWDSTCIDSLAQRAIISVSYSPKHVHEVVGCAAAREYDYLGPIHVVTASQMKCTCPAIITLKILANKECIQNGP